MLPDYNTYYICKKDQPLFVTIILSSTCFEQTSSGSDFCSENVKFVTPTVCAEGILFLLVLYLTQPESKRTKLTLNTFLHC